MVKYFINPHDKSWLIFDNLTLEILELLESSSGFSKKQEYIDGLDEVFCWLDMKPLSVILNRVSQHETLMTNSRFHALSYESPRISESIIGVSPRETRFSSTWILELFEKVFLYWEVVFLFHILNAFCKYFKLLK